MESKSFKKSEIIENFLTKFSKDDLSFIDEKNDDQDIFVKINKQNVRKAYKTLCQSYNKDEKSRAFVKHIVGAFYPVNSWNKVMQFPEDILQAKKNKCALTGLYVCGIKEIAELGSKLLLPRAKYDCANNEEEKKQAEEEFNSIVNSFPAAVKNRIFAYMSDKSDKYLSNDAVIALQLFVQYCILYDIKDIMFVLNRKRFKAFNRDISKKNKLTKSQETKLAKAQTYGGMSKAMLGNDAELAKKLLSIKDELDTKEKQDKIETEVENV